MRGLLLWAWAKEGLLRPTSNDGAVRIRPGADGKPANTKVAKRTVHDLPVTTIDVTGEYSGAGGPTATVKTVKAGYRLLGAIVESPGGNVFLKFTGPVKTIAANERNFQQLLESFQKQ